MGGRLDCTNAIENPAATIITTIGLDHTEHLGDTIEKIAAEKAGIIKANTPCIIGTQNFETAHDVIEKKAQEVSAKYITPIMIRILKQTFLVRIKNPTWQTL